MVAAPEHGRDAEIPRSALQGGLEGGHCLLLAHHARRGRTRRGNDRFPPRCVPCRSGVCPRPTLLGPRVHDRGGPCGGRLGDQPAGKPSRLGNGVPREPGVSAGARESRHGAGRCAPSLDGLPESGFRTSRRLELRAHQGNGDSPMTTRFDAITLEVLWTRIISVTDEAAKAIVRTSFSTLSNEANDFACVLTDARGYALAQNSGSIPSFIGTLPATVRHFLREFGEDGLKPGDVLITNDPWQGTGHMSDVSLVKPIFHRERLVAFSATTSHMPDIGGRVRAIEARELFEEGIHIPLSRIIRDGQRDETLIRLIRANVRTPDQTMGDIWAQVSANELME